MYLLAEAALRLGTDKLTLTVYSGWMAATPEASILSTPTVVDIERSIECHRLNTDDAT